MWHPGHILSKSNPMSRPVFANKHSSQNNNKSKTQKSKFANKLHLENNEDFEKLYVAILQFVFLETLKEEKICFPEKHSFD